MVVLIVGLHKCNVIKKWFYHKKPAFTCVMIWDLETQIYIPYLLSIWCTYFKIKEEKGKEMS